MSTAFSVMFFAKFIKLATLKNPSDRQQFTRKAQIKNESQLSGIPHSYRNKRLHSLLIGVLAPKSRTLIERQLFLTMNKRVLGVARGSTEF